MNYEQFGADNSVGSDDDDDLPSYLGEDCPRVWDESRS